MQTDVLVIGGGLSGLHTAYELHNLGIDCKLLEARSRLGGRILSYNLDNAEYNANQAAIDLGPSWFWPGQTFMQNLLVNLNLTDKIFEQASAGDSLYENAQGTIQRSAGGISMAGSYRVQGGIQQIIATLNENIPSDLILANAVATHIQLEKNTISTSYSNEQESKQITSQYVALALPPRVANTAITFTPAFESLRTEQLNSVATWMAGHAKLVSIYERPFWREEGLSGDAISHLGPLQEIHDASSQNGELHALFGFVSVPPQYRKEREEEIRTLAIAQLARLFGDDASNPLMVHFKDWASDPFTSTKLDQAQQTHHPANDIINQSEATWEHRLIWSGTESVDYRTHNNGFLEGALEASTNTISFLKSKLHTKK